MVKQANLIIIGGTIAAGKSTLVEALAKQTGWLPVPELREGDFLQEQILRKLYEGKRLHSATIQYYFLANRYRQYQEASENLLPSILDRGIWEDWIFAYLLMQGPDDPYSHYKKLWKSTITEAVTKYGIPKAYIFVKVDYETFKERIYVRNRKAEIDNFSRNEQYFRKLLNEYNNMFEDLLREWSIDPIVIDSRAMSKDEMTLVALKLLKQRNVL